MAGSSKSTAQANTEYVLDEEVSIPTEEAVLEGRLVIPKGATGVVLFAHGSGSSRHSPRNNFVAGALHEAGIATLLFDLLTASEEEDRANVFDIPLLASRLAAATRWIRSTEDGAELKLGYFGASTGAAAALLAAKRSEYPISAVVSRGGRPDLAMEALPFVTSPTLLIVGGNDEPVITMNQSAFEQLQCDKELKIVPNATHLFGEPGALEQVTELATAWFTRYLGPKD